MRARRRSRISAVAALALVAGASTLSGWSHHAGALLASKTALSFVPINQVVGYPSTLKANVGGRPAPTGTVEFLEGSMSLGTAPVVKHVAQLSYTFTRGTHFIHAVYSGDSIWASSTSATKQHIIGDPSRVNVDLLYKSTNGTPVSSFTATTPVVFYAQLVVKVGQINYGARTGTANVSIDGVNHEVPVKSNRIVYTAAGGLGLGDHTAVATYHGDIHYLADTSITRHITISSP